MTQLKKNLTLKQNLGYGRKGEIKRAFVEGAIYGYNAAIAKFKAEG